MNGLFIVFVCGMNDRHYNMNAKKETYISDAKTRKVIDAGLEMHLSTRRLCLFCQSHITIVPISNVHISETRQFNNHL